MRPPEQPPGGSDAGEPVGGPLGAGTAGRPNAAGSTRRRPLREASHAEWAAAGGEMHAQTDRLQAGAGARFRHDYHDHHSRRVRRGARAGDIHAHDDSDAAEAVALRAADVVASIAALRSATAARGYAAAIPAALAHLEAATGNLAATVDELRVEALWHLRDTEPAAIDDDHVYATARDFSILAGRLYAAQQATMALRERVAQ